MMVPAFLAPMLCHTLPRDADLSVYQQHICEEKFDGCRVIVCVQHDVAMEAWSKPRAAEGGGKLPPNRKKLGRIVSAALRHLPTGVYDGESLVPRIIPVPTRGRKTDPERGTVTLFDVLQLSGRQVTDEPWTTRRRFLERAMRQVEAPLWKGVVSASRVLPVSQKTVETIWARGGEGVVLKDPASPYLPDYRTYDWLKYKTLESAVLTIVGFFPGLTGPRASLVLRGSDGIEARCGAHWKEMPGDPDSYIGRRVRIEFMQRERTGAYRHPRYDRLAVEGE